MVDTILIREKEEIVRYRFRCDTVESVKHKVICDSIPYPVEVEVIMEVPCKHTWLDTLSYVSLGILLAYGGIKLSKFLSPPSLFPNSFPNLSLPNPLPEPSEWEFFTFYHFTN